MGKKIWVDTETTGLYCGRNAIIELAAIVEIDGNIEDEFTLQFKPHAGATIAARALEVNNRTEEEIQDFPNVDLSIMAFKKHMKKFIDKFDTQDKFIPFGYNILFDLGFIREAFKRAGDRFGIGSWFFNCPVDVWSSVGRYVELTDLRLSNYKLVTLCEFFGITLEAHNPISDIAATRQLYYIIEKELRTVNKKERAA